MLENKVTYQGEKVPEQASPQAIIAALTTFDDRSQVQSFPVIRKDAPEREDDEESIYVA